MNDPFEKQLQLFKPRTAPAHWKESILKNAVVNSAKPDSGAWLEIFILPRSLRWGMAAMWLAILLFKGMTYEPPVSEEALAYTPEVLRERWVQIQLAYQHGKVVCSHHTSDDRSEMAL